MRRANIIGSRGQTLIEVLIAVGITAVTVLGLIAVQLVSAREARGAAYREQAALIADAFAETARVSPVNDAALAQWKSRASNMLPKGDAGLSALGGGLSQARVTWAMPSPAYGNVVGSGPGQTIDAPAECGDSVAPQGMRCVVVAFAK